MEYDRALFRVYERILEDLNASPSPMAAYANSASAATVVSSRRSGRRRSNRVDGDAAASDDEERSNSHRDAENEMVDSDPSIAVDSISNGELGGGENEGATLIAATSNVSSQTESRSHARQRNRTSRPRRRRGRRWAARQPQQSTLDTLDLNSMTAVYRQFFISSRNNIQPIPFFLPIWMAIKFEAIKNTLLTNRTMAWNANDESDNHTGRFMQLLRRATNVLFRRNSHDATSSDRLFPDTPTRYRSILVRSNSRGSFRHVDSDAEDTEPGGDRNPSNLSSLSPDDNARDGLRRRTASASSPSRSRTSPSNSPSNRSSSSSSASSRNSNGIVSPALSPPRSTRGAVALQPRASPSPSLLGRSPSVSGDQDAHTPSSSSSSSSSSSWEDVDNENSERSEAPRPNSTGAGTTATSLTQRAIQMQLRQSERFQSFSSRRSSDNRRERSGSVQADGNASASTSFSEDDESSREDIWNDELAHSSSEDSEDPPHREGCSQRHLYRAMRLSFALGILHLFVLLALHVTYVGPHAFRRQTRNFVRRLKENEEGDFDNSSGDYLVNCISRALSTRSPKDRSRYDALFGNAENNNDGKRRLLREASPLDFPIDDGYLPNSLDRDVYYYDDDPWQSRMLENEQATIAKAVPQLPLLGKDEILQIKILYGGRCNGQCSRVRFMQIPKTEAVVGEKKQSSNTTRLFQQRPLADSANMHDVKEGSNSFGSRLRGHTRWVRKRRLINDKFPSSEHEEDVDVQHRNLNLKSNRHLEEGNKTQIQNESVDELSSPEFWEDPSYRFSIDDALLYLDEKSIYLHNVTIVNVTVTERCLSTGSDDGELTFLTAVGEFLSQIYGMDSIIINQLMFGITGVDGSHLGGHVQNMETKERWGWRKDQIETYDGNSSIIGWITKKLGILFMSLLAFFLVTSVTSLIVRVLTSSGVVLMFPLFTCFRRMGVPGADERILSLSYPWIGTARRAIRSNQTHPQSEHHSSDIPLSLCSSFLLSICTFLGHLVWAHTTKIVLYYVMYEACQAAWSIVLYAKSIPEALPVWIYGLGKCDDNRVLQYGLCPQRCKRLFLPEDHAVVFCAVSFLLLFRVVWLFRLGPDTIVTIHGACNVLHCIFGSPKRCKGCCQCGMPS
ncbi:hypothetical protein ACHAW6_015663 [Cyclotella cf. meneghiniana]